MTDLKCQSCDIRGRLSSKRQTGSPKSMIGIDDQDNAR
jgi:hypothetical protein